MQTLLTNLEKLLMQLNAETNIYGHEDTRIFVSRNVMAAYVRALGGFAANTGANGVDNRGTMWYADGGWCFISTVSSCLWQKVLQTTEC